MDADDRILEAVLQTREIVLQSRRLVDQSRNLIAVTPARPPRTAESTPGGTSIPAAVPG
jgi:hypothetical protein